MVEGTEAALNQRASCRGPMVREHTQEQGEREKQSVWKHFVEAAMSLQCKVTGLVAILIVTVTATVSGYLLAYSGQLAREQHDTQVVQAAALLAKAAAVTLSNGDPAELTTLAKESANGSPLASRGQRSRAP